MELKDRIAVGRWLHTNASLAEVLNTSSVGLIGNERFTERAVQVFTWLWTWSAPRFGGQAGVKQERVFQRGGTLALERRYRRVARIIRRLRNDYNSGDVA